ncbi:MAG: hypothetical protein HYU04_00030 [Candidatus Wildermuthbacteria bacterium]|nr:hypothetical protein [Candidatus Wildermuthbacteria bacterium]
MTKLECTFLSDALSMFGQGPPGQTDRGPYPDLLLKLCSALLEIIKMKDPAQGCVVVQMTEADLWLIREVSKTSIMVGSKPVGLELLIKVAKGLLELNANQEVQEAQKAVLRGQIQGARKEGKKGM